jgi:glutamate synthase domain-containing protein 3
MDSITKNLLDGQEGNIDNKLNFLKFKQILEVDFITSAIESFWTILEVKGADHEWIMNRLRTHLGEMDKEEAQHIYDTWEHVSNNKAFKPIDHSNHLPASPFSPYR